MITSEAEALSLLFQRLPSDWKLRPLKYSGVFIGGGTPDTENLAYWKGDIPWVSPKDMQTEIVSDAVDHITELALQETATSLVKESSVLIVVRSGILRRTIPVAVAAVPVALNQDMKAIQTHDFLDPRFLVRVIQGFEDIFLPLWRKQGATVESLEMERIGPTRVPIPPLPLQRRISKYLDAATAQIDALVAEKERMLSLLEKKRSAQVRRAITRGLDARAPLKASGYPWLGDIPKHWEIKRSKRLLIERDDRSEAGEEEMLTVSHLTGVTPRSEKDVNMFEAESNEGYKLVSPDNLVINTLWAWMGAMGVARHEGLVSPAYHVYRITAELLPAYVDYLVRTDVFKAEVTRFSKGVWSSRLRLYPEGLHEVWLPVPPLPEQRAIVAHLKAERERTAELETTLRSSIELLHDRRRALITAAVTGQIEPEAMTA